LARQRRRGTVYVLVLGVTALLIVFGVCGAMLARSVAERNRLVDDQAGAALLAQSYLELIHTRIDGSSTWRSVHTNDTWSTPLEALAGGRVSYKLADPLDNALNDDATDPVRLYTRATVGGAVRVYSIELTSYDGLTLEPVPATLRRESNE